jgi:ribonuclease Z
VTATITLLGTGGPIPDAHRAGPATLVQTGGEQFLVDTGRGVLMRLAAVGVPTPQLTAVLLTHLHSDHIIALGDVITNQWMSTFEPTTMRIVGPPGTRQVITHLLESLEPDMSYRMAHHDDLNEPPRLDITEVLEGPVDLGGAVTITAAPTDHRPVEPSVGFRFDHGDGDDRSSVVAAGDTVPCDGLDRLSAGADALVHTVIRKDLIEQIPIARLQDVLDYHSSPEQAAQTAAKAGVGTLVLTHYVPTPPPGGVDEWRELAAAHFAGRIEVGDDLHRVDVP